MKNFDDIRIMRDLGIKSARINGDEIVEVEFFKQEEPVINEAALMESAMEAAEQIVLQDIPEEAKKVYLARKEEGDYYGSS